MVAQIRLNMLISRYISTNIQGGHQYAVRSTRDNIIHLGICVRHGNVPCIYDKKHIAKYSMCKILSIR